MGGEGRRLREGGEGVSGGRVRVGGEEGERGREGGECERRLRVGGEGVRVGGEGSESGKGLCSHQSTYAHSSATLHSTIALTPRVSSASPYRRQSCTYGFQCSLDILYSELNMTGMMTSELCSINPTTYSLFHR